MALNVTESTDGKVVEVNLSGKLVKEDYDTFVPSVERLVEQRGKLRMMVRMHDFHGWTPGALWEDTKFAMHHFSDFERLAIVGETKWQRGMAALCKPFTAATIRYFDLADTNEALVWLAP